MYNIDMGNEHYNTWVAYRQSERLVDKMVDRRCRLIGTTLGSFEVLLMISGCEDEISAYLLGKLLGHEHHSVVEMVNRLKSKGLLVRGEKGVSITPEGVELVKKVMDSDVIPHVMESLGKDGLSALNKSVQAVRQVGMKEMGELDEGDAILRLPE